MLDYSNNANGTVNANLHDVGLIFLSQPIDLAKYPKLPDDYEVLTKVLSHRDDNRVRETLDRLEHVLLHGEKPRRGRTLAAQLRLLEDTHSDKDIREQAAKVRARL